jgi:hypothetical protein
VQCLDWMPLSSKTQLRKKQLKKNPFKPDQPQAQSAPKPGQAPEFDGFTTSSEEDDDKQDGDYQGHASTAEKQDVIYAYPVPKRTSKKVDKYTPTSPTSLKKLKKKEKRIKKAKVMENTKENQEKNDVEMPRIQKRKKHIDKR